ncbi:MAG: hypothetical protein ACI8W8_002260 [Rhodothermales bacterium]|jgi:hypothetical protein
MQTTFDIVPGFTRHVMRSWSGSFRARRACIGLAAAGIPAAAVIALGVWPILIIGLFCITLMLMRSRTRQQAALAALDDGALPQLTVSAHRDHVRIQSGAHSWSRRHACLLRRVTQTPEAIIMAFSNAMTTGIPLSALDNSRDWKQALDTLVQLGQREPGASLPIAPPGTRGASVRLPAEKTGIALTSKLVLLVFAFAGLYFCPPLETVLELGAGVLGYLAGVLFLMSYFSEWAFPEVSAPCEVILTDQGIYLHSGSQDAFCDWQSCVDIVEEHEGAHLIGDWGGAFISISGDVLTPEFADFARERIMETHGIIPSQEHEHDEHCDHNSLEEHDH